MHAFHRITPILCLCYEETFLLVHALISADQATGHDAASSCHASVSCQPKGEAHKLQQSKSDQDLLLFTLKQVDIYDKIDRTCGRA